MVLENINTGCNLIEKAFNAIGREGTEEQFYAAVGARNGTSVPVGTEVRSKHDGGFEQVRNAFFAGEGLGKDFVIHIMPGSKMRHTNSREQRRQSRRHLTADQRTALSQMSGLAEAMEKGARLLMQEGGRRGRRAQLARRRGGSDSLPPSSRRGQQTRRFSEYPRKTTRPLASRVYTVKDCAAAGSY